MYIADLHIHSRFFPGPPVRTEISPNLDWWARRKGIRMVGTGDFTHPAWRAELREQLVPAGEGVYTLRQDLRLPDVAPGRGAPVRYHRGDQLHLQAPRQNPESPQPDPAALSGGGGRALRPAGGHRQHPLRRTAHSGAGQPGPAGADPGHLPGRGIASPAHIWTPTSLCLAPSPASIPWRSASGI